MLISHQTNFTLHKLSTLLHITEEERRDDEGKLVGKDDTTNIIKDQVGKISKLREYIRKEGQKDCNHI